MQQPYAPPYGAPESLSVTAKRPSGVGESGRPTATGRRRIGRPRSTTVRVRLERSATSSISRSCRSTACERRVQAGRRLGVWGGPRRPGARGAGAGGAPGGREGGGGAGCGAGPRRRAAGGGNGGG